MTNDEQPAYEWRALPVEVGVAYQRAATRHSRVRSDAPGLGLGLPGLDQALGPLRPGDLVLVSGAGVAERLSFLTHCATHQLPSRAVAVVSLAHTSQRMVQLALAARGQIPLARLDAAGLEPDRHWPALADAVEHHHCLPVMFVEPPGFDLDAVRLALQHLRGEFEGLALLVVDALERVAPSPRDACELLQRLAGELGLVVVAGVGDGTPVGERDSHGRLVGSALVAAGSVRAIVLLPRPQAPRPLQPDWCPVTVRILGDHRGATSSVTLQLEPDCLAWREPPPPKPRTDEQPVSRREGKDLDPIYSAACCALLNEVDLAHHWDGRPHGPGRAWELPHDERLSSEQRLVVRVALDIWDNQGGVLLRDLRKLPVYLIADVGELIADTASVFGPLDWVERHVGKDWQHWMREGRWFDLLGAGWRELLDQPPDGPAS